VKSGAAPSRARATAIAAAEAPSVSDCRARVEPPHQVFQHEHRASDRRVESGGQTRAGARCNHPELGLDLSSNAIGKDFLPGGALFAAAPSGSGFQVSLYGLAGILLAADEGLELNILGLNIGIDAAVPALKLPAIGPLGLDR